MGGRVVDANAAGVSRFSGPDLMSTQSSLQLITLVPMRLEEAGLVEHPGKGVYTAVDQAPPPKSAWVAPLSGRHVARHAADGRVRDEMTMA